MRTREWRGRTRILSWSALAVACALSVSCGETAEQRTALPKAEFLFSSGDSTYWVRSSGDGMRVRSAPILLTESDGRLFEIFLSDEGAEYTDASFASARLWARDVQRRDSVLLFADSTVVSELARWRRAHPRDAEVDPVTEELIDDPRTVVHDEIEIVDVHGPYITVEHLLNLDFDNGPAHRHDGRRFVLDVRSGARLSLDGLIGASEASRVIAEGRVSFARLVDSIRTAGSAGDARAAVATETLDGFLFDSSSFGITDVQRDPAVAFMIPGHGSDGEALALYVPPILVTPPVWWKAVKATLPTWAADSTKVQWSREGYDVVARPSAEREALALALISAKGRSPVAWPIATVSPPAYQLIPLDSPPIDSASRAALSRAFDLSTALDGLTQRAAYRRPTRRNAAPRFRRAAFTVR